MNHRNTLSTYLDDAERRGQLNVHWESLTQALPFLSPSALTQALQRQQRRGRLVRLSRGSGHWVIVPLHYAESGSPPLEAWLDQYLARTLNTPYYVGLLSAAESFGASPYAVMVTQIAVPNARRAFSVGRHRLSFFTRARVDEMPTQWHESENGRYRVSSAEVTALELVNREAIVGGIARAQAVIVPLLESCSASGMIEALDAVCDIPSTQRLGALMDIAGHETLADCLKNWLHQRTRRTIMLQSGAKPLPDDRINLDFNVRVPQHFSHANT